MVPEGPGSPPPDPWASARERVRAEVAAALAPTVRRCPACGAPDASGAATCPRCGSPFVVRAQRSRGSPRAWAAAGLALAVGALVAAVVVPDLRQEAQRERAAAEALQRALVAAEQRRLRADAAPRRRAGPARRAGEAPLAHRARLVAAAESLVLADARGRVAAGRLEGPVRGAACAPFPNTGGRAAAERDPEARVGRYDCTAYKKRVELPEQGGRRRTGLFGYPYWAVIDYGRARVTWCKVTPRAGEGGAVLTSVPVPAPCRDPARRRDGRR